MDRPHNAPTLLREQEDDTMLDPRFYRAPETSTREWFVAIKDQKVGPLNVQEVELEGALLKPNMVLSGKDCPAQAEVDEVAARTAGTGNVEAEP